MSASKWRWAVAAIALIAVAGGAIFFGASRFRDTGAALPRYSYAELTGSVFLPPPKERYGAPRVRELALPRTPEATAIWGALGRDHRGHIWVGVSAKSPRMSAHLLEYDPAADAWSDRGGVVDRLKAAGAHRDGEGQVKIHTRIVPAADGWLYFASMDEEGEREDGSRLPRWGGHLWRVHPERHTWQHLAAVPEALIAVSGVGRYIYALGYWNHVLYQYDTETGKTKRVVVGSVGGHISRNFLADARGHAYVPKLSSGPGGEISVMLVEYDAALQPIAATPLEFYLEKNRADTSHGIVALVYLPDGRMLFTTHPGYLYQIEPRAAGPATVRAIGWLHPDGKPAYIASLFALGGTSWVGGVAQRGAGFEWLVRDLDTGESTAFALDTGQLKGLLLYGSVSRDSGGRAYVGGQAVQDQGGRRPVVLQIDPGR